MPDDVLVDDESPGNDTKEDTLLYFAHISNHYLCLVKNSSTPAQLPRHLMSCPIIIDSGANYHMFRDRIFLETFTPSSGSVYLGDGKTTLSILGVGSVKCRIGSHTLTIPNVRYIPALSENIHSLFQHIQCPEHNLELSYEEGMYLIFPTFRIKEVIGEHDIYLDALPFSSGPDLTSSLGDVQSAPNIVCRNISDFQHNVKQETDQLDNILRELHRCYADVKTKRQLDLDIPAGFRRASSHQKQIILHTPPRKSDANTSNCVHLLSEVTDSSTLPSLHFPFSNTPVTDAADIVDPSLDMNIATLDFVPIICSVDKPASSLPQHMTMTEDYLRACMGFRRVDLMKKHLKTLYQTTLSLDHTPADAVLDPGFYASLRKKDRNTSPVSRPQSFGDVIHLDIVFGPEVSIGYIHFGLLCVDRYSRMSYLYPLHNLTSDIPRQLEAFFAHLGMIPWRIVTDFDTKLVGGKGYDYLNSLLVHVNAAPSYRQDKNGLVEWHWQTIVSMARNWLASAELPSSFWFYAVRHGAEVCNYFPIPMEDGSLSTPFELVHKVKPDLRVLFKPFALAAVCHERVGDTNLHKFDSQSLSMITLGHCPTSNGLQFYNPQNGTIVSSIDYTFQPHVTSGSRFGYKYQPGTFIYRLDETNVIYSPKFPLDSEVLIHTHSPPHHGMIIGVPTYTNPDVYTVKYQDGTIAEYSSSPEMSEAISSSSPIQVSNILPDWVKGGATTTLFLSNMTKPRHGRLYPDSNGYGYFVLVTNSNCLRVFCCLISRLLSNNYWIRDRFFGDTQNFLGYIKRVTKHNSKTVFFVMCPRIVSSLKLHQPL
jgi:hypothetical protein